MIALLLVVGICVVVGVLLAKRGYDRWLRDRGRSVAIVGGIVVVVLLASCVALGVAIAVRAEIFKLNEELSDAQLEHYVAFLVAAIAATATTLGLLFTWSYNQRTHALARDAEARARVTAAAEFLKLLTTTDGTYAKPAQISGAIWSLMRLGHRSVAFGVAESAFLQQALDAPTVVSVVDEVLSDQEATDAELLRATSMLRDVSTELATADDFHWPISIYDRYDTTLPEESRRDVLVALAALLSSKDKDWWVPDRAPWALLMTYDASGSDKSVAIRSGAALLLGTLIEACPPGFEGASMGPNRYRSIDDLRSAAGERLPRRGDDIAASLYIADQLLRSAWNLDERTFE